ncbi:MAG TPA: hypothetical protein VN628_09160 [Vicinamibacterales bacterium]|nr:hypothetical protein [Vicinamibacterales bacterium]
MLKHLVFMAALLAQWLNYPAPGVPRLPNGKVDLSAKAPRTRDGRPDLSGVWQTELETPAMIASRSNNEAAKLVVPGDDPTTFSRYFFNVLSDFKPEDAPLQPKTREYMQRAGERPAGNPSGGCLPHGLPQADLMSYAPFKVIQTPSVIAFLYELDNNYRQIYTDGRTLPKDLNPTWYGYSVGRWEGDTLVVDAAGFNERTRLDVAGHPHSEALHITERFRRRDFGHLDVTITIDDPAMYTKPFTIKATEVLLPDNDVLETVCAENEKDGAHIK